MQPDKRDWDIIRLLSEQHATNTEIARRLGLSEGTVRQRLKRLQDEGILKIKALRDPNRLEEQQLALVAATIAESRMLDATAKKIAKLNHVMSVSILSGQYDLMIEIVVESNKGLIRFLTEELSKVEGITKTETFLILRSYNKWI